MKILPDPHPIHELRDIYQRTQEMKKIMSDQRVYEITGFTPAETFEKFLGVNGQPVFEEVLRL
jgi:hypothetical protein